MTKTPADVTASVRDPKRLDALRETGLLDSPREEVFDRQTAKVKQDLNAQISLISLIDENRQFFKSTHGLPPAFADVRETPLGDSVCQFVIHEKATLALDDMREHPVHARHVAPGIEVLSYLGEPLTYSGEVIGSICAIDTKPRKWHHDEIELLRARAEEVSREIDAYVRSKQNL